MNTQEKLDAMNTECTIVFIYSGTGDNEWHCEVQYDNYLAKESFKFKSNDYSNISEAVDEAYLRFTNIVKGDAFKGAIPAQLTHM